MNTRTNILNSLETRDRYNQALLEGAALRGELGVETQLRAMSAKALELRAAGNEDAYQTMKAEAMRIYRAC